MLPEVDSLTTLVEDIRASLADPARRHAIAIHMPIALSTLGVLVAVCTLILRRKSARIFAIVFFVAFAGSAFFAIQSGEDAAAALPPQLSERAGEVLDRHEDLAEWLWMGGLGVAAIFALSLVPMRMLGFAARLLGVVGALGLAGWTAVIGHYGGTLVYEHGVGTQPWRLGSVVPTGMPIGVPIGVIDVIAAADSAPRDEVTADARVAFFSQAIAPLLATECLNCHGSRRRGGLDMRSIDGLLKVGRSKQAPVVPGVPAESLLIEVVRGQHSDIEQMPPDEPLDDAQIALLVRWIEEGALWDEAAMSVHLNAGASTADTPRNARSENPS